MSTLFLPLLPISVYFSIPFLCLYFISLSLLPIYLSPSYFCLFSLSLYILPFNVSFYYLCLFSLPLSSLLTVLTLSSSLSCLSSSVYVLCL